MIKKYFVLAILPLLFTLPVFAQEIGNSLSLEVSIDPAIAASFQGEGRLFIFLSQDPNREPRTQIWPNPTSRTFIFAANIEDFKAPGKLQLPGDHDWIGTPNWSLKNVPAGTYYLQVLWDQDTKESRINAAGNIFSIKQEIELKASQEFSVLLSETISGREIIDHPLAREVDFKSEELSKWWGKEMRLKASILLPHGYDENTAYPIRYNVAGYGGRYDRINNFLGNEQFMSYWDSEEAPQVITVFLDGEGPFGDSYQMDSENNGPYGKALIEELIPHIENQYRGTTSSTHRYVDGCSTGGWVSLGLQLYYPDVFDAVFSYSPDAIAFENYQLVNIYEDENAYTNEFGYERPVMRDVSGEPMLSMRDFIQYENVLGASNTYLNSGGQFSAHTALYSPRGEDGLPLPLFHPQTGVIDPAVAEHWKKYDFKLYAKEHWAELGPKVQGKIYIWMGDMDHFYLNPGTREFADFIESTENPKSDAVIEFSPMEGHCSQFSPIEILQRIQALVDESKEE